MWASTSGAVSAFIGVAKFPARVKCALLGWSAFKDAVLQAQSSKEEAR